MPKMPQIVQKLGKTNLGTKKWHFSRKFFSPIFQTKKLEKISKKWKIWKIAKKILKIAKNAPNRSEIG